MKKLLLFTALIFCVQFAKAQAPTLQVTNNLGTAILAYFCGDGPGQPPCPIGSARTTSMSTIPTGTTTFTPGSFTTWGTLTPTVLNGVHFNYTLGDPTPAITPLCGMTTGSSISTSFMMSGIPVLITYTVVSPTLIQLTLN